MVIKDQNLQSRNNMVSRNEARDSYEKSLKNNKDTFDHRIDKMSKNYAQSKTKLEEENKVNKDYYESKTQKVISASQDEFKNKLKANAEKFQSEMSASKSQMNNKLNDLSSSYRTSAQENNRLNEQVTSAMKDRFEKANSRLEADYHENTKSMVNDHRNNTEKIKSDSVAEKHQLSRKAALDLDHQRKDNLDNKNNEIRKLKSESGVLSDTLKRENGFLQASSQEKIADMRQAHSLGMANNTKNYQDAIGRIEKLNEDESVKMNQSHRDEIRDIQDKFENNIESNKRVSEHKAVSGPKGESLSNQLKESNAALSTKLRLSREEQSKQSTRNSKEMQSADQEYRKSYKDLKNDFNDRISKKEIALVGQKNQELNANKKNLNAMVEAVKSNLKENDLIAEQRLNHQLEKNEKREKDQRIEFNKVANHINEKNIENLNSLKDDFSKDKTVTIEALKTQMADEKMAMKNDFNRASQAKDALYEQKLVNLEKQNKKISESYDNQISLIMDRSKEEIETVRANAELKSNKDAESAKLRAESIKLQKDNEQKVMRAQYETVIEKNHNASEQRMSGVVKKYEDQLTQVRNEHKKELLTKVSEAESKYNRLSRNSQINSSIAQTQYEQKLESVKLTSNKQEHSKNT